MDEHIALYMTRPCGVRAKLTPISTDKKRLNFEFLVDQTLCAQGKRYGRKPDNDHSEYGGELHAPIDSPATPVTAAAEERKLLLTPGNWPAALPWYRNRCGLAMRL